VSVSGTYEVSGIPHLAIYGSDGKLVFLGHPSEADLDNTIPALLKGEYKQ